MNLKKKIMIFNFFQIKCRDCGQQRVCCKCIPGIYKNINPCPLYRSFGEQ